MKDTIQNLETNNKVFFRELLETRGLLLYAS